MEREKEISHRIFRWFSGERVGPYECRLNPTNKCNLACLPCVSRGQPLYEPHKELSKDEYVKIVDDAVRLGVQRFDICGGGEPFCSPATIPILERIKKHSVTGAVSTNGTIITRDVAKKLVEVGVDEIRFSINGPDADIDDRLRGGKGIFDLSVKAIQSLVFFKKKFGKENPNILIVPIVTSLNYNKISEFIELAHNLGVSTLTFQPFMPELLADFNGRDEIIRKGISNNLRLNEEQQKELQYHVKEAKRLAGDYGVVANLDFLTKNSVKYDTAHLIKLDSGKIQQDKNQENSQMNNGHQKNNSLLNNVLSVPCYQPWWVLDISVSGGVGPCPIAELRIDARERGLSEIWYGDYFNSVREKLANKEIPSICQTCCVISTFDNQKFRDIISGFIKRN